MSSTNLHFTKNFLTAKYRLCYNEVMKKRPPRNFAPTKLKKVRLSKGITQAELAEEIGSPVRNISKYEQGREDTVDSTSISRLLRICLALDCKMEDILESTECASLARQYLRHFGKGQV